MDFKMYVETEKLCIVYAVYLLDEIVTYTSVTFKIKDSRKCQNVTLKEFNPGEIIFENIPVNMKIGQYLRTSSISYLINYT